MTEEDLPTAARNNNMERIKELLAEGVDVDWHRKREYNALWEACDTGNFELVKFLIDKGADINIDIYDISDYGYSTLSCATHGDNYPYELVEFLLDKGARIDHRNLDTNHTILLDLLRGYSPAIRAQISQELADWRLSLIKLFIKFKADLNTECYGYYLCCGKSIKQFAKETECPEIIELIIGVNK